MSNKEFWEDAPDLLWAYRKSYMEKLKIQSEYSNYCAWLNGLYVFDALSKGIYNSFGRKKGQPVMNYIEKPYDFNAKKKTKEEIEMEERLRVEQQIRERNEEIKRMLQRKKKV